MSTQPSDSSPISTPSSTSTSTTPELNDASVATPARSKSTSGGVFGQLWTLIFRLGLLTVGSSVALVTGIAIATIHPADVDAPPLLEKLLQQAESLDLLS